MAGSCSLAVWPGKESHKDLGSSSCSSMSSVFKWVLIPLSFWLLHIDVSYSTWKAIECMCVCVCVLRTQSCPTLCNPMDCSPPAPLSMARILDHFLLQGIFLTQGLNLGLPHCRQILYHLSHEGSPIIEYAVPKYATFVYWLDEL